MKMLNEILGTRYPVIQGGMANIATGAFAAACSEAGALGTIGSGGMNAEQLRKEIEICRKLTDKPFAVNLMLMHPQADEFAKIVAEAGVNHNGSLEMARRLIDCAADAGADAVKFQTFRAERLVTRKVGRAEYQIQNTGEASSQLAMLQALELDEELEAEELPYLPSESVVMPKCLVL